MTNINKDKIVDTSNLLLGELIHTIFAFYNVTSINGFTSMIKEICEKTRMIWVFPTASQRASVQIIRFILTTPKNEKSPMQTCKS